MRKFIAIIELITAAIVLVVVAFAAAVLLGIREVDYQTNLLYDLLSLAMLAAFCVLNFFAGVKLWRNQPQGYNLSFLAQGLQLFFLHTNTIIYQLYSLAGIIIAVSKLGISTSINLGFQYYIMFEGPDAGATYFGLNFGAAILIALLYVSYRKNNLLSVPE